MKTIILFIVTWAAISPSYAQPFQEWELSENTALATTQLNDSSVVLSGRTTGWASNPLMPVLTRIAPDGTKLWEKLINLPDHRSRFNGLTQGADGDVYAIGSDDNSIIFVRCSKDGDVKLLSFIDQFAGAEGYDIKPCGEDFFAVGELRSGFIGRYRSDGTLAWKRLVDIDSSDVNPGAVSYKAGSNNLTVVGTIKSSLDLYAQVIDTGGHTIRIKAFRLRNGPSQEYLVGLIPQSVINTADGGLLVVGFAHFYDLFDSIATSSAFCMKLDTNFKTRWLHLYRGTTALNSLPLTAIELHNEYFISASMDSVYVSSEWDTILHRHPIESVNRGPVILRIDSSGQLLESTLLSNGSSYYYGNRPVASTVSGGFVVTALFGSSAWLFCVDSLGHTDCGQTAYKVQDTSLVPGERDVQDSDLVFPANTGVLYNKQYSVDDLQDSYAVICPARSLVRDVPQVKSTFFITDRTLNIVTESLSSNYEIFDVIGSVRLRGQCEAESRAVIDLDCLIPGYYFLRINSSVFPFALIH